MMYKLNTSRVSTCSTDANPCEKYYDNKKLDDRYI